MKEGNADDAYAAALAGLPAMTPVRLAKLLVDHEPAVAWDALCAGSHPADPTRRLSPAARSTDVGAVGERYRRSGVHVLVRCSRRYPAVLANDPGAPAVLFARGDPSVMDGRRRVAIVGTRSATPYGRQVASELGRDLASAGVVVISGLAVGIDGAAHAGALGASGGSASGGSGSGGSPAAPVAVVGTGLDVVYPTSNTALWENVATRGVVFSESALGTPPRRGVFPARNRIIAALADVVVIVESHFGGGSLYTADAAARRSIPVCAVPGSVRSRASDGTNGLLVDGCTPVRDADDVLVAVSLARAGRDAPAPGPRTASFVAGHGDGRRGCDGGSGRDRRRGNDGGSGRSGGDGSSGRHDSNDVVPPAPSTMTGDQRSVWSAVEDTPTSVETILLRTDLSIAAVAEACEMLVTVGALRSGAGWWSRR